MACLHRLSFYLVGELSDLEALLYSDDWMGLSGGRGGMEDMVGLILVHLVLGFPFNWGKFRGGIEAAWIGYELNFEKYVVGISLKRAEWLASWSRKTVAEGRVDIDDLVAVLGRFSFAMGPLDFLRPFLAPIFAWAATARGVGRKNFDLVDRVPVDVPGGAAVR